MVASVGDVHPTSSDGNAVWLTQHPKAMPERSEGMPPYPFQIEDDYPMVVCVGDENLASISYSVAWVAELVLL
eukprot:CAMPEP_0113262052 /NCGR_PEP_ID=MMETSP0008_2-20120614/17721_1 /TAXON_ID=97485 /ORGANISM="Prymnesium parvum" /LENGTH=72 /DNA_ID=CAMNT_0000110695 /DNA_START=787 /DNA_END=1001 /DNA_ORIENTATION=+ /assembly_acc=CAM_ASM_000153